MTVPSRAFPSGVEWPSVLSDFKKSGTTPSKRKSSGSEREATTAARTSSSNTSTPSSQASGRIATSGGSAHSLESTRGLFVKRLKKGWISKKLKRFKDDSPSCPSRGGITDPEGKVAASKPSAAATGTANAVVDLCSSDEEPDDSSDDEEQEKAGAETLATLLAKKRPPSKKRPPTPVVLPSPPPGGDRRNTESPVANEARILLSLATPPSVDLSDSENNTDTGKDNNKNESNKDTSEDRASNNKLPSLSFFLNPRASPRAANPEASPKAVPALSGFKKLHGFVQSFDKSPSKARKSPVAAFTPTRSKQHPKRSEDNDSDGDEDGNLFGRWSKGFSVEQKRVLLASLAPEGCSPEAIEAEDWEKADIFTVCSAFSKRFGVLRIEDLEKLVKGEFIVPKGMVGVRKQEPTKPLPVSGDEASEEAGALSRGAAVAPAPDTNEDVAGRNEPSGSKSLIDAGTAVLEDDTQTNGDGECEPREETRTSRGASLETADDAASREEEANLWECLGEFFSMETDAFTEVLEDGAKTNEGGECKPHKEAETSRGTPVEIANDAASKEEEAKLLRAVVGEVVSRIVDSVGVRRRERPLTETGPGALLEDDFSQLRLATAAHRKSHDDEESPLVVVSAGKLLFLALPLVCLAVVFARLGLFDVSNSILEGCFRTFFQLHVLGCLLSPIFKHGIKRPVIVVSYALFMIVLASYEASSRTKYTHDDQFYIIVQSLVLNVGWVALWAFGAILKPRPVWNPQYVLPIVGMLLGNSINGVSLTLDTITTSLVERHSEVDLYLSFGATQFEAVSGIVAHAIQKGTTPALNMMCVVGIVSIPGMMTGQILGGSSPLVAARYQAMIIFLIALCTLSTILLSSFLTVVSAFCSHQILRPERFVKNRKRGLARLILWAWGYAFGSTDKVPVGTTKGLSRGNVGAVLPEEVGRTFQPSPTSFRILPLKKGSVVSNEVGTNSLIQVSELNRYFMSGEDGAHRRVLFDDLSLSVNEGDLLLVSGPSGTGKSQLLRMIAGLSPLQDGTVRLDGRSWNHDYNGDHAVEWRKQVRYVSQTKVQIPGTPRQFLKRIQSFRSWKAEDRSGSATDLVMKHVSHHIRQWGMGVECLDREWTVLSGGESQRVLVAIALASRPKILLFDESTSALDYESKLAVEASVKDFVEDHEGGVLWVSHDELQAERMMDSEPPVIYDL
eukprot:CAMPEP_0201116996 /NCGR_PEP_ID=MMETSP0850-20130426/1119_1 /ASSEMBLY_ACC=CAM_ASM_000622 /TAXON_ID=183588 /ORGANISM="Pseudo-nitzschia fraudulenta, Strain WWA7" /LENGTH=1188 /DNA_ID=CAMNT_0047381229 /DNA_START=203 /DNA_END=3769 /DNA_ORIENTATION=-